MNVLHISTANTWRGGEQQVAYLLEELVSASVDCHLWSPKGSILLTKIAPSVSANPYTKRGSIDLIAAYRLKKYVFTHQISLIHCHDSHAHTMVYLSSSIFGLKTPCVVSRRVDFPIKASSKKKYNHHSIKAILCVSEKIRTIISPSIKDHKLLHTVHSGVDLKKFESNSSPYLRQKYNIPKDHFLIGNVAALADHKDYLSFLHTAKKVLDQNKNCSFLAIGKDDGQGAKLKSLAQSLRIESKVIFTGYIDNVWQYIHELDVFLFTSKEEGLGTSLLDALASKVPVVSTNAGGIPEIIEAYKTGLVAEIGDTDQMAKHIINLIKNPLLRSQLVQEGLIKAQKFSKQITAHKTLNIYGKILADN